MIHAIDEQARQAWEAAGKTWVDVTVTVHPQTFADHIEKYCLDSHRDPRRCMVLRWGGLYVQQDMKVGVGLALLSFSRKVRSERPEDV